MDSVPNIVFSSFKGTARIDNWDGYLVVRRVNYSVFAVFDGVSNALNGGTSVRLSKQFLRSNCDRYLENGVGLSQMMFDLNRYLSELSQSQMYCTYCILYLNHFTSEYVYSWLGDSRIYRIDRNTIQQLTVDDLNGENLLSKCLGLEYLLASEFPEITEKKDQKHLLLCTDGFYKALACSNVSLNEIFANPSLDSVKQKVFQLVTNRNADDATYVLIQ